jgi:hypothetical protein
MISPPNIALKPSWIWSVFLLLMHIGAVFCILFLAIPNLIKILLVLFCILSFSYWFRQQVILKNKNSIVKLWQERDGEWSLLNYAGQTLRAQLRGDSVVTRYWVLLNFNLIEKRKRISVMLCPDALPTNTFRQLRVWLLHSGFSTRHSRDGGDPEKNIKSK